MNRRGQIELLASLPGWPSAATCAFLAGGLEIISQVSSLTPFPGLMESIGNRGSFILTYAISAITVLILGLIFVCSVAFDATALWGVSRRERTGESIGTGLGWVRSAQWAVIAYVAANVPLFVLLVVITSGGFDAWPSVAQQSARILANKWAFGIAAAPLTLAFGCLGLASSGGDTPRQRWASHGLLAAAALGIVSASGLFLGLPARYHGQWLRLASVALHAAMWVEVGVWLTYGQKTPRGGVA